mmetsp:Transcript_72449/g.217653  ORF Transcript_72449/g.217653 Transcript_72449/m.217653 type:complete len:246 (+) Transcript_72449:258-995(+)|eukprot:7211600-Prymnesium_polylepis.2
MDVTRRRAQRAEPRVDAELRGGRLGPRVCRAAHHHLGQAARAHRAASHARLRHAADRRVAQGLPLCAAPWCGRLPHRFLVAAVPLPRVAYARARRFQASQRAAHRPRQGWLDPGAARQGAADGRWRGWPAGLQAHAEERAHGPGDGQAVAILNQGLLQLLRGRRDDESREPREGGHGLGIRSFLFAVGFRCAACIRTIQYVPWGCVAVPVGCSWLHMASDPARMVMGMAHGAGDDLVLINVRRVD